MGKNKDEIKKDNHAYDASSISVLEGLEPVRKRPGMYIGSTGPDGLQHMLKEIFDNSRDEAMGGFADEIEVVLLPEDVVRIADNGRGIPVDKHKKTGVSALETVMTTLHAGGKFDNQAYKVSGGLHGVGASVVNALSEWTVVEVHKDGKIYAQEYARGKKKASVKEIGKSKGHGTIVTFKADKEIFSETEYKWERIIEYLRQQAYLVKKLRVRAIDARAMSKTLKPGEVHYFNETTSDFPNYTFYFEGGLMSLVKYYNSGQKPVHDHIFYVEKQTGNVMVEVSLQYVDDISATEISFANNTPTAEGGAHVQGFRTALTRTLNNYAKKGNFIKDGEDAFTGDDVREGITAVVSVKMPDIQFEGQTKGKLGSVEATGAVATVFGEAFSSFLEENPDDARSIINKVIIAVKARKAAKAAKDSILRKGALEGMTLPGKLADCQTRKAEEGELWIVEGDSAGGSSKQGRDRRTQAVLPLRGKILNVERARLDKMLASNEIKSLVIAIGTAIGEVFNLEKLRYHKIIIATDADVDGAHIRTLLLTLFFRYFRPLIDAGHIYIAQPPLYKIKIGKEKHYVYSDAEKNKLIGKDISMMDIVEAESEGNEEASEEEGEDETETKSKNKKPSRPVIQRYKGLGEMNPEELWETTMDPETRVLKQVNVEDAVEADKTFDILMGDEVPPRKLFIQTNAKLANLDV
ncbi:MAG TPA: DNA topoisomerase subunit B [Candidatus Paceibacterota bacterium]